MPVEEFEKMEDAEELDDENRKALIKLLEEKNKNSEFERIQEMNDWKWLLYVGSASCIIVGAGMPIYGT